MLISIFFLFVFIDLATRGGKLFGKALLPGMETVFYYFYQFSNYLNFFFPLSFLLASIQVLLDLNAHQELVALQMGGLSSKRLALPFFALASILSLLLLANYEWVTPKASLEASAYVKAYAHHKKRPLRANVHTLILSDGSEMVFQKFSPEKKELFDVFWLEDETTIWHIKFLQVNPTIGHFVDQFKRVDRLWQRVERRKECYFPQITIDEKKTFQPFIPYERRSLFQLASHAFIKNVEQRKVQAHLLYKLTSPLLLFLSILAIMPTCFTFSRSKSAFKILSFALFSFLAAMMILDGLLVLGENQVILPSIAFGCPLLILTGIFCRPFVKKFSSQ